MTEYRIPTYRTLHMLKTLGRHRALQTASNERGVFTILAVDHRDAMRGMINPDQPDSVPASQLTEIKLSVVREIADKATAVLIDPIYSVGQSIAQRALPARTAFLSAIEDQGYLGDPFSRETPMLDGWGIEKAKLVGASGVKVLLLYNPESEAAERQDKLVASLLEQCAQFEIPLFLEPIVYSLDRGVEKGSAEFAPHRRRLVIESARRLGALHPDILKLEFPLDCKHNTDEAEWQDACAELNETSSVPWTLLSGGDPFDVFQKQLKIACQNGCSGFLVGRALWREAVYLQGEERTTFLRGEAMQRWQTLRTIAETYGTPWFERYAPPQVDEGWYKQYKKKGEKEKEG